MFIPDFGAFMKQLRAAGVTTPVVTVDGNDSDLLIDSAGKAVDGVVFSTSTFPVKGSLAAQFKADYQKVMGKKVESNTLEAIGRDNVYAIAEAAADAKSTDPTKILDAIYRFKNHPLVTGKVTMDKTKQIPQKEVWLVKMKGTKFTYLDSFLPKTTPAP
jgi:branched-chain amino acid transport system substrate-binding protein